MIKPSNWTFLLCVISYLMQPHRLSWAAGDRIFWSPCHEVFSPEPVLGTYSESWCSQTWRMCRATLGGDRPSLHNSQNSEIIIAFWKQTNKLESSHLSRHFVLLVEVTWEVVGDVAGPVPAAHQKTRSH